MLKFNYAKLCVPALCAALFAGCSGEQEQSRVEDTTKTIVIGIDNEFPPMGYKNANGEIVGFDIDLAREAATRMKRDITFHPIVEWGRKEELLSTGEIDCIWASFAITPERAESILFTPPYLENFQIFLVRDDSGCKTLDDLAGKIVGLQIGSTGTDAVKANAEQLAKFGAIKDYTRYDHLIAALENGEVDAIVIDTTFAIDSIQYKKKPFRIIDSIVFVEQYGIGFRPEDTKLCDQIWAALKEMEADGTVANISKKWFDQNLSVIK